MNQQLALLQKYNDMMKSDPEATERILRDSMTGIDAAASPSIEFDLVSDLLLPSGIALGIVNLFHTIWYWSPWNKRPDSG